MKHALTTLIAATGTTFISAAARADAGTGAFHGDHQMMWGNGFMGPMMMLVMLVIGIVVIVIILKAFGLGGNSNDNTQENALNILNERFAKGEIDKDEYEERKSVLNA